MTLLKPLVRSTVCNASRTAFLFLASLIGCSNSDRAVHIQINNMLSFPVRVNVRSGLTQVIPAHTSVTLPKEEAIGTGSMTCDVYNASMSRVGIEQVGDMSSHYSWSSFTLPIGDNHYRNASPIDPIAKISNSQFGQVR